MVTDLGPCVRLLPFAVHETHSKGGRTCGRPAVDLGPYGDEPRCAVHRGVDKRTETNRAIAARARKLLRKGKP